MTNVSKIGSFTLSTGTYNIDKSHGFNTVALKLLSGSATYKGADKFDALDSAVLPLVVDEPVTIGGQFPIDSLEIVVASGSVEMITTNG